MKNLVGNDGSRVRQKSNESNTFKRAFRNIALKAKNAGHKAANLYENISESPSNTNNLKNVLKGIKKCWIKFPNSYSMRDRTVIYKPYKW